MKKNQKGFSLIELLIVVVIIGIIAAIAIPNLLASRRAANESSAIGTLRTITGAQATYLSSIGQGKAYGSLATLQSAGLTDASVASTTGKSGYVFTSTATAGTGSVAASYLATAVPVVHGAGVTGTGSRSFATNETGVIYFNTTAAAPVFTAGVSAGTALGN